MRLSLMGALCAAVTALSVAAAPASPGPAASAHGAVSPWHGDGAGPPSTAAPHRPAAIVAHYVDINSASRQELMTLPGIGAAEANRIIANRPYLTKTGLVTKKVLPIGPFLSVKDLVIAMPKAANRGSN